MKLDAAYVNGIAKAMGFDLSNLEKVIRLRQLLIEFHKHPVLRGKLVLKGGTAVNLFYLDLVRLSADIDLNYIGQLDREGMLQERPEIVKAVEQISIALGYKVKRGVDSYVLVEWYLAYRNHTGGFGQIQVEVNFLMRVCALAPKLSQAASIGDEAACEFSVLAIEELFGGKTKAMIDRQHPRDLYDLFRFGKTGLAHDSDLLRRLAVLFLQHDGPRPSNLHHGAIRQNRRCCHQASSLSAIEGRGPSNRSRDARSCQTNSGTCAGS